jgi:hypothetical protein
MSIAATGLRHSIAIDTRASAPVGSAMSFGAVCLWTTAGLTLTALVFTLGLGADIGQFLTTAG